MNVIRRLHSLTRDPDDWPRRCARPEDLSKSSLDSQDVRFMIATRSPQQIFEVGLLSYQSEKNPCEHGRVGVVVRFLRSDLFVNTREYRHVSRISRE
jgi:hypothetical protein